MNDREFEAFTRRFMAGLEVSGPLYRPKQLGETVAVEALGVIAGMRTIEGWLRILNSQLVLNVVIFTDSATITDAEKNVMPELLHGVFRLAESTDLWTGK